MKRCAPLSNGFEVGQDVHVDQVGRAELAHARCTCLPHAARFPRVRDFAIELGFGVDVL